MLLAKCWHHVSMTVLAGWVTLPGGGGGGRLPAVRAVFSVTGALGSAMSSCEPLPACLFSSAQAKNTELFTNCQDRAVPDDQGVLRTHNIDCTGVYKIY